MALVHFAFWCVERIDQSRIYQSNGAVAVCDRIICIRDASWMRRLECGGTTFWARNIWGENQGIYKLFVPHACKLGTSRVAAGRRCLIVSVFNHFPFWHGRCDCGACRQGWICCKLGIGAWSRNAFIEHSLCVASCCCMGTI